MSSGLPEVSSKPPENLLSLPTHYQGRPDEHVKPAPNAYSVGERGIPGCCTPSKRDTRLRYSPTLKNNVLILAQGVWRTFRDSRASRLAGFPEALPLPGRYQRHINLLINLLRAVGKPFENVFEIG